MNKLKYFMRSFSHKKLIIEIIFRLIMNTLNLKYLCFKI